MHERRSGVHQLAREPKIRRSWHNSAVAHCLIWRSAMIVVRNVFRVKFGKAKEAVQLWKDGLALSKRLGFPAKSSRVLTDLVGDFYTVVFENTFESLAAFENGAKDFMGNAEWQAWYAKVVEITESGHREIFNIVAE